MSNIPCENNENLNYLERILRKIDEVQDKSSNEYYLHTGFIYLTPSKPNNQLNNSSNYYSDKITRHDTSDSSDSGVYRNDQKRPREQIASFCIERNLYQRPRKIQITLSSTDSESEVEQKKKLIIPEIILPSSSDQKIEINSFNNESVKDIVKEPHQNKFLSETKTQSPQLKNKITRPITNIISQPRPPTKTQTIKPIYKKPLKSENRFKRFLNKFNPMKLKEKIKK